METSVSVWTESVQTVVVAAPVVDDWSVMTVASSGMSLRRERRSPEMNTLPASTFTMNSLQDEDVDALTDDGGDLDTDLGDEDEFEFSSSMLFERWLVAVPLQPDVLVQPADN